MLNKVSKLGRIIELANNYMSLFHHINTSTKHDAAAYFLLLKKEITPIIPMMMSVGTINSSASERVRISPCAITATFQIIITAMKP
jgi:hypothetical protein